MNEYVQRDIPTCTRTGQGQGLIWVDRLVLPKEPNVEVAPAPEQHRLVRHVDEREPRVRRRELERGAGAIAQVRVGMPVSNT